MRIQEGLCQCGCGNKTTVAKGTSTRDGLIKGVPVRFCHGHGRIGRILRFKRKVTIGKPDFIIQDLGYKTPCWVWQGCTTKRSGYAVKGEGYKTHRAHKLYYEKIYGPVPEGFVLDHLCHSREYCEAGQCLHRRCIRPDHLEAVTDTENTRRGFGTKLTVEDVLHVREMCILGVTQSSLAKKYGVDPSAISNAARGRNWADVPRRV